MTPEEKAQSLIKNYELEILKREYMVSGFIIPEISKQCAAICVREIMNELGYVEEIPYWQEVLKYLKKKTPL